MPEPYNGAAASDNSAAAGAPEIEITPDMIDAGKEALWDSEYDGTASTSSSAAVFAVLQAALERAGFACKLVQVGG